MALIRRLKHCRKGHEMHPTWKICPTCLKPVVGWLLGVNGAQAGQDFPVREGKNTVGALRKNDIQLLDPSVSPEHAFIRQDEDDVFIIADLNSAQGTYVNGLRVHDEALIDNYQVRLGDLEFIFKCVPRALTKR
jgi:pSer/pThr/pTyr-binding forkhead associated (FHA) protein